MMMKQQQQQQQQQQQCQNVGKDHKAKNNVLPIQMIANNSIIP